MNRSSRQTGPPSVAWSFFKTIDKTFCHQPGTITEQGKTVVLAPEYAGRVYAGVLGNQVVLAVDDTVRPLMGGAVALVIEGGTLGVPTATIGPAIPCT
jgi:hypothetical protein